VNWLGQKWWVWLAVLLPSVYPFYRYGSGDPVVQANGPEYFLNYTGTVAMVLLLVVISLTPLRVVVGGDWIRQLNRHRRLIGVASWGWGTAHLLFYIVYAGSWSVIVDNFGKIFIVVGLSAWALLLVLAVTSLKKMMKRLGGVRWKRLHRSVYLVSVLVLIHFGMQEKAGVYWTYGLIAAVVLIQVLRMRKEYIRT